MVGLPVILRTGLATLWLMYAESGVQAIAQSQDPDCISYANIGGVLGAGDTWESWVVKGWALPSHLESSNS